MIRTFACAASLGMGLALLVVAPANAYIDSGGNKITLPEILLEFRSIAVVEIDKADEKRGIIRYKIVEQLKGKKGAEPKHQLNVDGKMPPQWKGLKAGQKAVCFTDCYDKRSLTLLEGVWYRTDPVGDGWEKGGPRKDFDSVFTGSAADLTDTVKKLLRGQDVTVRCKRRTGIETQFARYSLREPHRKLLTWGPTTPGPKEKTVSHWTQALQDRNPTLRLQAILALEQFGSGAKDAVPALTKCLDDKDAELRSCACITLGAIGPEAKASVPALAKALEDEDWFVCVVAAQALEKIGPEAKPAVPALTKALKPNKDIREYRPIREAAAAQALVKIDPKAKGVKDAVTFLVDKMLNDDREDSNGTRVVGAKALGQCGPSAQSASPALAKRLKDKDAGVRIATAAALMKIEPGKHADGALAVLTAELKNTDVLIRVLAAEALGEIGPKAKSTSTALEAASKDGEAEVRDAARKAKSAVNRE